MQSQKEQLSPTTIKLTVTADKAELDAVKQRVLSQLGAKVKVPGFRPGKAPQHLIEKQLDQPTLQTEFLERAVNDLYVEAVQKDDLRPVVQPEISITKFVPYTTLEFTAQVDAVGEIKLADYKKIKLELQKPEVTAAEVNTVVSNLRQRAASRDEVKRAAKLGDETVIDFKGVDAKTSEPVEGADGKDYPLVLGSNSFIPGFETELIGLKPGDSKTFDITFPKDYGAKPLQNRKVSFTVTINKVVQLSEPKADDAFAASVGPFKTLADLKADIKRQLKNEKQQEQLNRFDNELLEKIAAKSEVAVPDSLIEEEIDRIEAEEKRDVVYRGQTWQEHLDQEGVTAESHRQNQRPGAELRVKAGLILGAIAKAENVTVSAEELEMRMQLLKGQYPDSNMQAELDKPENRRDIHLRMMTEKTLTKLRAYAQKQ